MSVDKNSIVDAVDPNGPWKFDGDVARVFDDMLQRSIPQYAVMRKSVFNLAVRFQQPNTTMLDLGCSRGEALAPLVDRFGADHHLGRDYRFIGVDVSEPMLAACNMRFKAGIEQGLVKISKFDLRTGYPLEQEEASVTLAVLVLQFTPIEHRLRILSDIYKSTVPGGVLILVEKVIGADALLDQTMVDLYYGMKRDNDYTESQIERKRLSLEGVLVPLTAKWNEEALRGAGFHSVDCFWRWMNFAGWVAVKDG